MSVSIALAETPWIGALGLACYLGFRYWYLSDISVEASFSGGMIAAFQVSTSDAPLATLAFCALVSIGSAVLANCVQVAIGIPRLFAGLIALLALYSLNFWLLGKRSTQAVALSPSLDALLGTRSVSTLFAVFVVCFAMVLVVSFDRSSPGLRCRLHHQTTDTAVANTYASRAWALPAAYALCHWLAWVGGLAFALQNRLAANSLFGYLSSGLACMFVVAALRMWLAQPSRAKAGRVREYLSTQLLRSSDHLAVVAMIVWFCASVISLVRFELRGLAAGRIGVLNGFIAGGCVAIWIAIGLGGRAFGKKGSPSWIRADI